jgi:hypothetical protein
MPFMGIPVITRAAATLRILVWPDGPIAGATTLVSRRLVHPALAVRFLVRPALPAQT